MDYATFILNSFD